MKTKQNEERPPKDALRVYKWADLPGLTEPAEYLVSDPNQEPRKIWVSKHKRQVLEGLMKHPIYAASYARISDQVSPLRHDLGVDIATRIYRNDAETGRKTYGVYFLKSKVVRVAPERVAA